MKIKRFAAGALAVLGSVSLAASQAQEAPAFHYPEAPRSATVEDYHGVKVGDPYRPLEDPDSPATRAWVEAENKITFAFLEAIQERSAIRQRLTALWDYEKFSPPQIEGGRYFFTHNTGLQNQAVLSTADSLDAAPRTLLDPNLLSQDGTVALAGTEVSKDGKLLAYGIAAAGSDWNEWKVRDVATGRDLSDHLKWIKFSTAAWSPDGKGFFYGRFPEPKAGDDLRGANYHQKVYYHRVGTAQADDLLVWEDPEHKEWRAHPTVTDDGKYLIFTIEKGTDAKYRVLWRPLAESAAKPEHLVGEFEAEYEFIDNDGPVFWFKTNKNAAARQGRRHRHAIARARALEGADPRGPGDARVRRRRGRPLPGRLPERRAQRGPRLRPLGQARSRRRSARHRHRRLASRAIARTARHSTRSPRSPPRPPSTVTIPPPERASSGASPASSSIRRTMKRSRSSTPARTGRRSRCS